MHKSSAFAALSFLSAFGLASPVLRYECTLSKHEFLGSSTDCLTAFESMNRETPYGSSRHIYRTCSLAVEQPTDTAIDISILQEGLGQLMASCPYGNYFLDATTTLRIEPVMLTTLDTPSPARQKPPARIDVAENVDL